MPGILHVELAAFADEGLHPEGAGAVGAEEAVADDWFGEGSEAFIALLKLGEVEAEVLLAVGEFLDAEEFHGLFGGSVVVGEGVVHGNLLEDGG